MRLKTKSQIKIGLWNQMFSVAGRASLPVTLARRLRQHQGRLAAASSSFDGQITSFAKGPNAECQLLSANCECQPLHAECRLLIAEC
jgi:hypothetical protein